jgi:hypothetical protein
MQITIRGFLVGPIWWPAGEECFKRFTYDVTREDQCSGSRGTLRDHVLAIIDDGDFQHCRVACGELAIEVRRSNGRTTYTKERRWPLAHFSSIADCLRDDLD